MLLALAHLGGRAAGGGAFVIGPLILLLLIGLAAYLVVRRMRRNGVQLQPSGPSPGLKVLEERYAAGDIERDEFLAKREDLIGPAETDSK